MTAGIVALDVVTGVSIFDAVVAVVGSPDVNGVKLSTKLNRGDEDLVNSTEEIF